MKKPAAAPGKSGAAGIGSSSSWKEGIVRKTSNATDQDAEQPEEEHGNFEGDPVLEDGEVHEIRDRAKHQKFQTMLANGELPPFIQEKRASDCHHQCHQWSFGRRTIDPQHGQGHLRKYAL